MLIYIRLNMYLPYSTPLKYIWGCFVLILQTWKGNIYFTELAERVEYSKYEIRTHKLIMRGPAELRRRPSGSKAPARPGHLYYFILYYIMLYNINYVYNITYYIYNIIYTLYMPIHIIYNIILHITHYVIVVLLLLLVV